MQRIAKTLVSAFAASVFVIAPLHGALLSQYTFDEKDATDSVGPRDLSSVGSGVTFSGGTSTFPGTSTNYLQTAAFGSASEPTFTVSLWVNASTINQGTFKGLFANNSGGASVANSWQIDSNNGAFRLVSQSGIVITGPTSGAGAPVANTWQNVVLRKVSASSVEFYVDGTLVGTSSLNLGNLNSFRLGINRTTDNSYAANYDLVQIWDSTVSVSDIVAAGRLTPAHSWIAGKGSDLNSDTTWLPVIGGQNINFASTETYTPTFQPNIPFTYTTPAGTGAANSDTVFGGSGNASFEMAVRLADLSGQHVLWEVGGAGSGTSLILVNNELRLSSQTTSTANLMVASTILDSSALSKWLDIIAVLKPGSGGSGAMDLYVNGVLVATSTIGSGYSTWAGGNTWGVGVIGTGGNIAGTLTSGFTNFDGSIALFNHYDYALTSFAVNEATFTHLIPAPAALPAGLGLLSMLAMRGRK
ncbi:MAG: hypothetical protein GC162_05950 [Planctomycetes bacterium]|nr:hypothetical protein [Planctomycetota bacterium]